jgi:hypothetical protein
VDPTNDYEAIVREIALADFPFEFTIGTDLAQMADFAIPSIGELLVATGQFVGTA